MESLFPLGCTCDPESYEIGPEGQRRFFEDRYCPFHGEEAQEQMRARMVLRDALQRLLDVAETEIVGYTDCAACRDAHEQTGEGWAAVLDGHDEDCPLYAVEKAREALKRASG